MNSCECFQLNSTRFYNQNISSEQDFFSKYKFTHLFSNRAWKTQLSRITLEKSNNTTSLKTFSFHWRFLKSWYVRNQQTTHNSWSVSIGCVVANSRTVICEDFRSTVLIHNHVQLNISIIVLWSISGSDIEYTNLKSCHYRNTFSPLAPGTPGLPSVPGRPGKPWGSQRTDEVLVWRWYELQWPAGFINTITGTHRLTRGSIFSWRSKCPGTQDRARRRDSRKPRWTRRPRWPR